MKTVRWAVRLAAAIATAILLAALPARADWIEDLRLQLEAEEACITSVMTSPMERGEGANRLVQALVTCADGRRLVAYRRGEATRFTVRDCARERGVC